MGDSDLGQLFHYRFSLPFHDETQTTDQPPRPIPIHIRDQVANDIKTWQDLGIISETQSYNNIPLIILRKPDKSIRISLDARGLNQLLVKDRFPLPHMTTVFSIIGNKLAAGESCFISSLDLIRAYWQSFIDLVDYGRPDSTGKRYLLTCCDSLTGYLDDEPISSKSDKLVARSLLKIILRHGMSGVCVYDNGIEFGPLCKEIFKKFELCHVTTTAYRCRSNGELERLLREIHIHLKNTNAKDRYWSLFWPEACYYINYIPNATLDGLSANEALFEKCSLPIIFRRNDQNQETTKTQILRGGGIFVIRMS
ncbi:unnamed protein product [Oikopleura dioica]|uniref:Integrase catalytic domain-containing protein n=1 Tax=Oikopleura dioica TaxID=34765 RepID=E4XP21_OIKDI|nr:unnamed protein product [Oikopleura dioica]